MNYTEALLHMKRKILDFMLTACCMAFSFLGLVAGD